VVRGRMNAEREDKKTNEKSDAVNRKLSVVSVTSHEEAEADN
jgi:hypothetical protein